MAPTGQRSPNEGRREAAGGTQNVHPRGGVGTRGGDTARSGTQGHDSGMRCGMCGEGFGKPEDLDQHLAEAHARKKG